AADAFEETAAERSEARVPHRQARVGDRMIAGREQTLGVVDPQLGEEVVRRRAEGASEETMEVPVRKRCLARQYRRVDRMCEVGVTVIAGATEPAEGRVVDERSHH